MPWALHTNADIEWSAGAAAISNDAFIGFSSSITKPSVFAHAADYHQRDDTARTSVARDCEKSPSPCTLQIVRDTD
jgi:hypothetical protein